MGSSQQIEEGGPAIVDEMLGIGFTKRGRLNEPGEYVHAGFSSREGPCLVAFARSEKQSAKWS